MKRLTILALDCLTWLFCVACFYVYTKGPDLPFGWELKLLPWCGRYAYSDGWADFRETCAWNRAGRPREPLELDL